MAEVDLADDSYRKDLKTHLKKLQALDLSAPNYTKFRFEFREASSQSCDPGCMDLRLKYYTFQSHFADSEALRRFYTQMVKDQTT